MNNKNVFSAIGAALAVLLLCSCGGGRHSQSPSGENLLFSWEIILKTDLTKGQRHATIDKIVTSVKARWTEDGPAPTYNLQTLMRNERFVLLYATAIQGTQPKTPHKGTPHNPPDCKEYKNLYGVEDIFPATPQQFNEGRKTQ